MRTSTHSIYLEGKEDFVSTTNFADESQISAQLLANSNHENYYFINSKGSRVFQALLHNAIRGGLHESQSL